MIDSFKSIIATHLVYGNNLSDQVNDSQDAEVVSEAIRDLPLVIEIFSEAILAGDIHESIVARLLAAISYVFQPIDVVPEIEYGLIGYLDDCYVLYQTILDLDVEEYLRPLNLTSEKLENYALTAIKYVPIEFREKVKSVVICFSPYDGSDA